MSRNTIRYALGSAAAIALYNVGNSHTMGSSFDLAIGVFCGIMAFREAAFEAVDRLNGNRPTTGSAAQNKSEPGVGG